MAFKLSIKPYFWALVSLSIVGDLGVPIKAELKAKFRRPSQDEYQALIARINERMMLNVKALQAVEAGDFSAKPEEIKDQDVIDNFLVDWAELLDENDQPLAFTTDNCKAVMNIFGARAAFVTAFFNAFKDQPEKNSGGPLATS
jgi:hypothetical protein